MYDKVVELINQYEEKGDFTYAVVNDVIIAEAEKVLDVNIPEQYLSLIHISEPTRP